MTHNCIRCGRECLAASKSDVAGQILNPSLSGHGCCADCGITCFIKTSPLKDVMCGGAHAVPGFDISTVLHMPHIQAQFATVFAVSGSPALSGEINWENVIEKWDLPIPDGWDWNGEIRNFGSKRRKRGAP